MNTKIEELQKTILQGHGCKDIEYYCLISNYGYTFKLNDKKYDIRYWANCYGVALNRWEISIPQNDINYDVLKDIEQQFNQLEWAF